MEQLCPVTFFSPELCARYFTYMVKEGGIHFVLFDDERTVEEKIKIAGEMGLVAVVAAWHEVSEFGLM